MTSRSAATPGPPGRLVVSLIGDPVHGQLAESRFVDRRFLPGGEHNMYELAFAAAAAGWPVELRGWLHRETYEAFRAAAGTAPSVDLEPRPPIADDLVVVPEGWRDPLDYARLLLSPARLAIFILAAPGLFGWSFQSAPWSPPDPLTVALNEVATPAQFRAMHELGFSLLTHSPGIQAAAQAAGAPCSFVGTGRPYAVEAPGRGAARSTAVAALLANRWAPLVERVAGELDDLSVDLIEEAPNSEVLVRLSRAQILLWPSRIEGHATIPWEARSVGCVPVALSTNRFAVGLDEGSGAVVVDTVDELAPAIRRLFADRSWLSELSARAREHARAEVDWGSYVERVGAVLAAMGEPSAARDALAGMGSALAAWQTEQSDSWQRRLEELTAEQQRLSADRDRLAGIDAELERVRGDRDRLAGIDTELERVRADRDRLSATLDDLYSKSAVRIALRLDSARRGRQSS